MIAIYIRHRDAQTSTDEDCCVLTFSAPIMDLDPKHWTVGTHFAVSPDDRLEFMCIKGYWLDFNYWHGVVYS